MQNRQKYLFIYVALILIVVLGGGGISLAQDPLTDKTPPQVDKGEARRAFMRQRLLDDRQPQTPQTAKFGLVECIGGMADIYPCDNVDLLAFMPLNTIGATGDGNDIWGWIDPQTNKEYIIMGVSNGASFIDVSNSENPVYLGILPTHSSSSIWRDIKVYANHAFVVSEAGGHGMQVFDLTQLRNVVNPPVTFAETAYYDGFGSAHNLVINEETGFAYAVGSNCGGGLHMVNIQNPVNPTSAGCVSEDGYTHDAQCVVYRGPDADYWGKEICFNANEDSVTIFDVTNKSNPELLSVSGYVGSAYAHQGWVTEDHQYYLLGDELDEQNNGHNTRTYIWNITDLDAPVLVDNHTSSVAAIDHNMYVRHNLVYQANYRAGLRILDLDNVGSGNLTEVGFFDTFPSSNSASFNGAWSNYPYLSGVIAISDIDTGLYLVRRAESDFNITASPRAIEICGNTEGVFNLSLGAVYGFMETVTLSATGAPGGSTVTFADNPVIAASPAATTTLTLSDAPVGIHNITIIGTSPTHTHQSMVTIDVIASQPSDVILNDPPNGSLEVNRKPTLVWNSATDATQYWLEVASDNDFNNVVYSATVPITNHTILTALAPVTTYYWRVKALNTCGEGGFSSTFNFTTEDVAPILLVDDDDNNPNVQSYYVNTLNALGVEFDIWNTNNTDNEPDIADLAYYQQVIWFAGDEYGGAAGPGNDGEIALSAWLDSGNKCFFISGQDYFYDRNITNFINTYLGLASAVNDTGNYSSVTGQGGIFGGLGPYTLDYPFQDYSDPVTPNSTAELAFIGNNSNRAAISKDNGTYITTFFAFPFEAISAAGREEVMDTFLSACNGPYLDLDKTIETSGNPNRVALGSVVTYTIMIENGGDEAITNLMITDTLPSGITFENWLNQGSAILPDQDTITWGPYNVLSDTIYNIAFTARVTTASNFAGQTLVNTVAATSDNTNSRIAETSFKINVPPAASSNIYQTLQDTPLIVAEPGILGNDNDADGDTLTAVQVTPVNNGSLTLNMDGSFMFTPTTGFTSTASFTYQAFDGVNTSNIATVIIDVTEPAPNNAPQAVSDVYSTVQDTPLIIVAPGVLNNDTDPQDDPLTAHLSAGPANGTATLNLDGSFTYTPTTNFIGSDSFTYRANDGILNSNIATVIIDVTEIGANTPPLAVADTYTVTQGSPLVISAPGLLDNDTDAQDDTLSAILDSNPTNGHLTLQADGSFTYTPNANFTGTDSFTYQTDDGLAVSDIATATIMVLPTCDIVSGATITQLPPGDIYVDDTLQFTAGATGTMPFTYSWTLDGNVVGQNSSLSYQFTATGSYTLSVAITNNCGEDSTKLLLDVLPITSDLSPSTKTASAQFVQAGDWLTYTITLINQGEMTATATLTDPLPTDTTYIVDSGQASDGRDVTFSNNMVHWSGDVISGTPVIIRFEVQVLTPTTETTITNIATVDDGFGVLTTLEANAIYQLGEPALMISKWAASSNSTINLPLSSIVTYTIVLSNTGDGTANQVMITDTLPTDLTFGSWLIQGDATYSLTTHQITWGPATVAVGTHQTLAFTASVGAGTALYSQTITNTAYFNSVNAGMGADYAVISLISAPSSGYTVYIPLLLK